MGYTIRRASGPNHEVILYDLQRSLFPYDDLVSPALGYWWLLWYEDGSGLEVPVGFAGMTHVACPDATLRLLRAAVGIKHRGKGLQKRLISVRENKARRLGMRWVATYTYGNPPSTNNLISRGFRLYTPSAPWGGAYASYWRKSLVKKDQRSDP